MTFSAYTEVVYTCRSLLGTVTVDGDSLSLIFLRRGVIALLLWWRGHLRNSLKCWLLPVSWASCRRGTPNRQKLFDQWNQWMCESSHNPRLKHASARTRKLSCHDKIIVGEFPMIPCLHFLVLVVAISDTNCSLDYISVSLKRISISTMNVPMQWEFNGAFHLITTAT